MNEFGKLEKSPLKVRVAESVAQDEHGWFWITELLISGPGEEVLHLRSPEYFKTSQKAQDNLETQRSKIFDKINESLQEIGLFIDTQERLH